MTWKSLKLQLIFWLSIIFGKMAVLIIVIAGYLKAISALFYLLITYGWDGIATWGSIGDGRVTILRLFLSLLLSFLFLFFLFLASFGGFSSLLDLIDFVLNLWGRTGFLSLLSFLGCLSWSSFICFNGFLSREQCWSRSQLF